MGKNRAGQIFDIVGKYIFTPSKRRPGLAGPHQRQGTARTGTISYGRVVAGRPDNIRNVFPDRSGNVDASPGQLQLRNVIRRCHGIKLLKWIGFLESFQYADLFSLVRISQVGF